MLNSQIKKASQFIAQSDYILIGSGAGMGKDSGLPDFRGNQGFWNHYPPYKGKFDFYQCANPQFLERDPHLFWGFYGSRLRMYRQAKPHKGFQIIKQLNKIYKKQMFIITSNVDGLWQKASFKSNKIYQVHGNIHWLQCDTCYELIQNDFQPEINFQKMSCINLPRCKRCQSILRPNILMFNDWNWMEERSAKQEQNYREFLCKIQNREKKVCVVQIGAGTAVSTIRNMVQKVYYNFKGSKFIRINPDQEINQYTNKERWIHLETGALSALLQIQKVLKQ